MNIIVCGIHEIPEYIDDVDCAISIVDPDFSRDLFRFSGDRQIPILQAWFFCHSLSLSYEQYIQRVKGNKIALSVKIADMRHNCDLSRISNPTAKDYAILAKYQQILPDLIKYQQESNWKLLDFIDRENCFVVLHNFSRKDR